MLARKAVLPLLVVMLLLPMKPMAIEDLYDTPKLDATAKAVDFEVTSIEFTSKGTPCHHGNNQMVQRRVHR